MTQLLVNIFIWKNKAYLPVLGKTEVGFFWEAGPLLTAELTPESLTAALEEIIRIGNPPIHHPTQAEFQRMTPVQRALGMRSWKKMAQAGVICCVIYWTNEKIGVAFSPRNAKDIQEIDYIHQREFPLDTPLRDIVEYILEEVKARQITSVKFRNTTR